METTIVVTTVTNDTVQVRHKPSINKKQYIQQASIIKDTNAKSRILIMFHYVKVEAEDFQ